MITWFKGRKEIRAEACKRGNQYIPGFEPGQFLISERDTGAVLTAETDLRARGTRSRYDISENHVTWSATAILLLSSIVFEDNNNNNMKRQRKKDPGREASQKPCLSACCHPKHGFVWMIMWCSRFYCPLLIVFTEKTLSQWPLTKKKKKERKKERGKKKGYKEILWHIPFLFYPSYNIKQPKKKKKSPHSKREATLFKEKQVQYLLLYLIFWYR